jgi:hypothetical protein
VGGWTVVEVEKLKYPDGVVVIARVIHGGRKKQKGRRSILRGRRSDWLSSCSWESIRRVNEARPGEGDERGDPDFGRPKSIRNGAKSWIDRVAFSEDDDPPVHEQRLKIQR